MILFRVLHTIKVDECESLLLCDCDDGRVSCVD